MIVNIRDKVAWQRGLLSLGAPSIYFEIGYLISSEVGYLEGQPGYGIAFCAIDKIVDITKIDKADVVTVLDDLMRLEWLKQVRSQIGRNYFTGYTLKYGICPLARNEAQTKYDFRGVVR